MYGTPNNINPNWGRRRLQTGYNSIHDITPDNYGFASIACGGNYRTSDGGIRNYEVNPGGIVNPGTMNPPAAPFSSMGVRLTQSVGGGAYITPFEGPFFMPQYNDSLQRSDD